MRTLLTSVNRRGTVLYITVLSTALLVSLLGLAGLTLTRVERRQLEGTNDRIAARANAAAAVELALLALDSDPDWRNTYKNGIETTPKTLGPDAKGTVSWILQDTDGSLKDADTLLRLKGIGRVDGNVQVSEVRLQAPALTSLGSAMHAQSLISIKNDLLNNQTISSNDAIDENGGVVTGAVEAVNSVTGDGYLGTVTTGIAPRTMPNASVFDYYLAHGTPISILSLPGGGTREMKNVVLSPAQNPYGPTNPQGIYIIDCLGYKLKIRESRIVGTIVLLNSTLDVVIGSNVIHWEPAVANYPSLLVSGSVQLVIEYKAAGLDEDSWGNFNPPGTPFPYQGGTTDNDDEDVWPSEFHGLIYATGDIWIDHKPARITGSVISGGTITIKQDTDQIYHDDVFLKDPPPGFVSPTVQIVGGSWNWGAGP